MSILKTVDLIKQFKQYDKTVTAVRSVSVELEDGEFVAIVGPSGSGKSTFINLCAGLDTPTAGQIYIRGNSLTDMTPNELAEFRGKSIGFVFQSCRLVPYLTALENILLPLTAADRNFDKYKERLKLLVEQLGLADRLHHLPSELSGGQQQRVALARALIHYPQILFADEPTGNLDRESADQVLDLMLSLRAELRQTLIVVTHDERIAQRADRVLVMDDGVLSVRH